MEIEKELLGFSKIVVSDRILQEVCCVYCHGKGYFWELFFGWRKTSWNSSGVETMTFLVPTEDVDYLFNMAQGIKRIVKN